MEICVLIPAKNEGQALPNTIVNIQKNLVPFISSNILVVNDYSQDNTVSVLKKLSEKYKNVSFINNELAPGVGNAIRFGLMKWKGDIVAICMADNCDSPEDIKKAFYKIQSGAYDCVFGSRFIDGAKVIEYPLIKLVLNRIFNYMVRYLFSFRHNDFTNLFKVFHRKVINNIMPLESTGFSIGLEMSLKTFKKAHNIAIIPLSWRKRTKGVSKFSIIEQYKSFFLILKTNLLNEK
jgi:dolichol-phosphate mannosyltransferase